ncbi:DUF3027 domain-containing protein [Microbacterium aureliae]
MPEPDPALLDARDTALSALREITPEATIGMPAGYRLEDDGVVSLRFENRLGGYPGWYWTVSLARVEGEQPTVLEVELLPGDGALVAPEWVPWAERLAEYQAAQAAAADESGEGDDEAEDDESEDALDDVDDLDEGDFDADGSPILHAGDVDGVDIDELADDEVDDESDDDDGDEESDDDDDDEESDDDDDDDESDDDDDDDESDDDDDDDESDDDDDDD